MSKATVTGQIVVTSNGTTLHPILQCNTGDIYQNYDGNPASPSNVVPNFEASGATKPKLVMQAYSAEQGAGNSFDLSKGSPTWIVADVTLTFNASHVSTNTIGGTSGHFTEGSDSSGNPTLTVNKNLININGGDSFNIICKVSVSMSNTSVTLQAMYPVYIAEGVTDSKRVNIIATSDKNLFTITEKGGTCTVKAQVTDGNMVTSTGYTFKWYLPDANGGWVLKQNSTSATFTINETDVDSSIIVKCEAYKGNDFYASDTQTINDVSDEYILYPNPTDGNDNPVAENFIQNSGGRIVYKPYMRKRGSTANETGVTFSMSLYSNAGVPINSAITKSGNTFTITEAGIRKYEGAVYSITGTK